MRHFPFAAVAVLALTGCTAEAPPDTALSALLDNIERRLALAEAVALHKWDTGQPVQATLREQQVLANVRAAAPGHGLAPQRAEAFFADQMEANKLLQYTLLSDWHREGTAPHTQRRDLQTDIRPQLDDLQGTLLQRLAAFDREPAAGCSTRLAKELAGRSAPQPLHQALVRATGQLCDKS
ncbi:chorismate mutase [Pseudomonas sp. NY5710]|uniref:chorismate mutase n=1 Tax=Pseudomonas TaxID=286 RepID=UPI00156E1359|nr:chorismate mutase [Pseudomonas sp. NY5710]QKL04240.1 chorismate mutase [Pseudomonas sp. NY5710]